MAKEFRDGLEKVQEKWNGVSTPKDADSLKELQSDLMALWFPQDDRRPTYNAVYMKLLDLRSRLDEALKKNDLKKVPELGMPGGIGRELRNYLDKLSEPERETEI